MSVVLASGEVRAATRSASSRRGRRTAVWSRSDYGTSALGWMPGGA